MSSVARLCQQLATLLPMLNHESFPERLVELFQALIPADDIFIVAYHTNQLPLIAYNKPADNGVSVVDQFVKAAFLLDPYYQLAREGTTGFFRLDEIAPRGFRDSEYYRAFYTQSGYQDECGYLVKTAHGSIINISLAKTQEPKRFSQAELHLLRDLQPTIDTLCQQHWNREQPTTHELDLRGQLHSALMTFGSSLLTTRESQVIRLILHGCQASMIASKFSISVETVKLHRKHAYAKLGIKSQAELFHLFLDALMSSHNYTGGDTLEAYLKPPAKT